MLVANFVGHKGLVRWKWTVTWLHQSVPHLVDPFRPATGGFQGRVVDPAAVAQRATSISVVIVMLSLLRQYRGGCALRKLACAERSRRFQWS